MFSKATLPQTYFDVATQSEIRAPSQELPFSSVSVPRLVSRHSALHPQDIAVQSGSKALSYEELDRRANQIARYLVSQGVTTETPVGLYFDRSITFVISALGVLKAGGVYVPLDSSNPLDRILFMISDSQISLVLTGCRAGCELAKSAQPFRIHMLDDNEICSSDDSNYCADISPEDLAYIIYTSGSTGRPKGVEVTHRGLSNLIRWHQNAFSVTSADRASQVANLGFDAAVWEIWPYLTAGASVHFASDLTCRDGEALRDWLIASGITISFVPTPIAERVLSLEWPNTTALRALLTGGDKLHHSPRPGLPFALYNNYGPTESTVVATSCLVPPTSDRCVEPSIGRPIDHTDIYILDESRNPVPSGTLGEIYIGGTSIARGYRNRPELTAERFVADTFSGISGARLYRTGDLGCYLPNGEIAFRGRVDDQIKIRGYRIEPDEIVSVLNRHAAVSTSFVIACQGPVGGTQLVAYILFSNGSRPSGTALREFLRTQLPEYMIPSCFISVDELPLTANGKVDRKALPCLDTATLLRDEEVAPANQTQEKLLGIVSSLLRARNISTNDNFFLIGGHSLLGAQLIAKVKETFGVELSLLKLFENGTVAGMAEEIDRLRGRVGNGDQAHG